MITIHKKDNGRYTILNSQGEAIFYEDYYKIEPLNEDSFYYCLYSSPTTFVLYHKTQERFIGSEGEKCSLLKYAAHFDKMEDYSSETRTFVVRLWNDTDNLLMKDCERIEGSHFIFVGRECGDNDRSRPVQLLDRSHIFFNCKEFKPAWNERYSYHDLDPNEVLGERFDDGSYFTVCEKNGKWHKLAFYDKNNRIRHTFSEKYDEIEQYHKRYLICKIHGKDLFTIYNKTLFLKNEVERVTFADRYFEIEDGLLRFKSLDLSHWVLFKTRGAKLIENINWTIDKYIEVIGDFIFHGTNTAGWKIYSLDDSEEIYTGWKNIKLTRRDNTINVVVDTDNLLGYEFTNIKNDDIEAACSQFIEKLSSEWSATVQEPQPIVPPTTQECEPEISAASESIVHRAIKDNVELPRKKENKAAEGKQDIEFDSFPDRIDFVCILDHIKKSGPNHIMCNRKASSLATNDIILFIDEKDSSSYCCRYIHKSYSILWHSGSHSVDQKLIDALNSKEKKKVFHKIDLTSFDQSNVFSRVVEKLETHNEAAELTVDNEEGKLYDETLKFLTEHGFEKEVVSNAMAVLMPNFTPNLAPQEKDDSSITFTFDDDSYTVQLDSQWTIDNPFKKRRFLRKSDFVFIWINQEVFKEYPHSDSYDYDMIGEGLNTDQYFANNNSNGDIRDGKKRILLFKKIDVKSLSDPLFLFFDEVEYVNHEIVLQDDGHEVIKFHLKSKLRKKQGI